MHSYTLWKRREQGQHIKYVLNLKKEVGVEGS